MTNFLRLFGIDVIPFEKLVSKLKDSSKFDIIFINRVTCDKCWKKIPEHQVSFVFHLVCPGHFPLFVIRERIKDIMEALIRCTEISASTLKWAESRKEALHSLILICQTLGIDEAGECVFVFRTCIPSDNIFA